MLLLLRPWEFPASPHEQVPPVIPIHERLTRAYRAPFVLRLSPQAAIEQDDEEIVLMINA
jgi:hypothetical protein